MEEVWAAKALNREVVREAQAQVSQLLSDVLDSKKALEQKALSLFAGYVTLALAAFGLVVNSASSASPFHGMFGALCAIGVLFSLGAFLFVAALWDGDYGSLGSGPETWLRDDVVQSADDEMVYRVVASVVRRHHERIEISIKSNATKMLFIRAGMIAGAIAPLCLLAHALVSQASS